MEISVLYEDNHLLVINKPVNVAVQADRSGDLDVLSALKQDLKVRYQKSGNVFLGLVHRLDRPVGGVMVFAKTSKAASRLADMIRRQAWDRHYLAVVHGELPKQKGQLTDYLWKDEQKNKVYVVPASRKGSKRAVLEYEVLQVQMVTARPDRKTVDPSHQGSRADHIHRRAASAHKGNDDPAHRPKRLSLVRVRLITGRSHQIRVQLANAGCSLYGDQKYGQKWNRPGQQLALWAHQLQFTHPVGEERKQLQFTCSPPKLFPWSLFLL